LRCGSPEMAVTWWIPVVCGIMVLLFEVLWDAGSS
jgi:hypothetical protein